MGEVKLCATSNYFLINTMEKQVEPQTMTSNSTAKHPFAAVPIPSSAIAVADGSHNGGAIVDGEGLHDVIIIGEGLHDGDNINGGENCLLVRLHLIWDCFACLVTALQ